MDRRKTKYRKTSKLKPRPGNPRTHSEKQIRQLVACIKMFGFTVPVLIDENGYIIAGHCRVEAARRLGLKKIPTIRLSGMTEAEIRAYVIADNRLAELAGWDDDLLKLEFEWLSEFGIEIDLEITGFDLPKIDVILADIPIPDGQDPADFLPDDVDNRPVVSRLGDLWLLGDHRLLCGDATDLDAYRLLMAGLLARMVFTDPPYNVPIGGNVSGLGKKKHREFVMGSGEMDDAAFLAFLVTIMRAATAVSVDGALHYLCIDWRHIHALLSAAQDIYTDLKNICVWNKSNGGMGSLYRSKHELVAILKSGKAPHVNNVQLGKHGRNRTNVWDYAGMTSPGAERDEALALHPTVKPVTLVADAILDASNRGDIVLDPFVGSGTSILAAERTGRRCFAMELDPRYVDVAIRRFQQHTGQEAVHAVTGQTFNCTYDIAEMLGEDPTEDPSS